MPKELKELKKFMHGTFSAPSGTDIPDEASTYSLNLDPVTETGKLKGIADHLRQKPYAEGIKRDIRYWSTVPDLVEDTSDGVAGVLAIGDKITITLSAGDETATTGVYTCASANSNTNWKAIFQLFTSDTLLFDSVPEGNAFAGACSPNGGETDAEACSQAGGTWTASNDVLPLDDEATYDNIEAEFADILESVYPTVGLDTSANTGVDEELPLNGIIFTAKPEFDELIVTFTAVNSLDATLDTFVTSLDNNTGVLYTNYLEVAANEMAFLKNDGKDILIYQDNTDLGSAQINIVDDFYGTRTVVDQFSASADPSDTPGIDSEAPLTVTSADDISMETYYNALYLGPGSANNAKWAGYLDNKQMGETFEGFDLQDAELFPVDGAEGSASISRGIETWTAASTPATDYWVGINGSSYKLFTINKATGLIVASDDTLPVKPILIATCKHAVANTTNDWANIYITDKKTNNIYRIEDFVIDGEGKITWATMSTIAYSFGGDGSHNKPSESILVDLLETYEAGETPSNVLWGLFAPSGAGSISHEDSCIFSCQVTQAGTDWAESSEYVSITPGADDSMTFRDRTPNTRKILKRHSTSHYDDGDNKGILNYNLGSKYISNHWNHEREVFHYKYKKPTDSTTFDARHLYVTPEDGFASVEDVYDDDKLTTVKVSGFKNTKTGATNKSNHNSFYSAACQGMGKNYKFFPFKLVDMSQDNFDTDIASAGDTAGGTDGARAHCCMATGVMEGTVQVDQSYIKHYHKRTYKSLWKYGPTYYYHDFKWYVSHGGRMIPKAGVRGFKTSTAHYGYKHVYKYGDARCTADISSGTGEFLRTSTASGTTPNDNDDVRGNIYNSSNKVGSWSLYTNITGVEDIPLFTNVNDLLGLEQVSTILADVGGSDDSFNQLLLTYKGSELENAYIACVDKATGQYVSGGDQPASPSTATTVGGVVNTVDGRALQGPVVLCKEEHEGSHDILISPTAGQYENGFIRLPNDGAWTDTSDADGAGYTANAASQADFGIKIAAGDVTDVAAEDAPNFLQANDYYYKLSLIYDGFQESPLTLYADKFTPSNDLENILLTVFMKKPVSQRATHVVLYRKKGADEFYKMVKEVGLGSGWLAADGESYKKVILDDGTTGATYESITGMPETLRQTSINYTLSTQHDGSLVIANCDHPEINNGDHFIFKSQPGNLAVFNWAQDYLILPNVPTAIKSYAGKVFAWDNSNMHRVNMQNMAVEDSYEGVGCFGENAVLVTDLGMFFCDTNNMYIHTGSNMKPIGAAILQSSEGDLAYAWHDINHDTPPQLGYNAKTTSVYFCFNHKPVSGDNVYKAWVYNIRLTRWDLIDIPKPMAVISGPLNELLVSDGEYLWELNSSKVNKKWSYYSKDMTMETSTQIKVLKSIKIEADDITALDGKIVVDINDAAASKTLDTTGLKDTACIIKPDTASKKFKKVAIKLTDVDTEVDSIGVIYRRKKVK